MNFLWSYTDRAVQKHGRFQDISVEAKPHSETECPLVSGGKSWNKTLQILLVCTSFFLFWPNKSMSYFLCAPLNLTPPMKLYQSFISFIFEESQSPNKQKKKTKQSEMMGRWSRTLINPISLPAQLRILLTQQMNTADSSYDTTRNNTIMHRGSAKCLCKLGQK